MGTSTTRTATRTPRRTMIASLPCTDSVLSLGIPPALFTSTSSLGLEAKNEFANVSTCGVSERVGLGGEEIDKQQTPADQKKKNGSPPSAFSYV